MKTFDWSTLPGIDPRLLPSVYDPLCSCKRKSEGLMTSPWRSSFCSSWGELGKMCMPWLRVFMSEVELILSCIIYVIMLSPPSRTSGGRLMLRPLSSARSWSLIRREARF